MLDIHIEGYWQETKKNCNIPYYRLLRFLTHRNQYQNSEICPWEQFEDLEFSYFKNEILKAQGKLLLFTDKRSDILILLENIYLVQAAITAACVKLDVSTDEHDM